MLSSTDIESLFCLCIFSILERFFLQNKDRLFDAQIKKVSEFEKKKKKKKKQEKIDVETAFKSQAECCNY